MNDATTGGAGGGPSLPVLAEMRYAAVDPWAVRVSFQVGSGRDGDGTPAGASKANGRWYIESLGAGRYLVTHITWAN